MVAEDVVLLPRLTADTLHIGRVKTVRVKELVVLVQREAKSQVPCIAVAIKDVDDGAAGRLVRLQEHNVFFGLTDTVGA